MKAAKEMLFSSEAYNVGNMIFLIIIHSGDSFEYLHYLQ